jgi:hypothetical protein
MFIIPELLCEIFLYIFQQALHAMANKSFFALAILWKELLSAQLLLHLLPSNIVVRYIDQDFSNESKYHYVCQLFELNMHNIKLAFINCNVSL